MVDPFRSKKGKRNPWFDPKELADAQGHVREMDEPSHEPKTTWTPPEANVVPDGPAANVLAWVGDDFGRAKQALDAENEREKPRKTLIPMLEEIVGE